MGVWEFIQDHVLGMQWLNELIGNILSMLGVDAAILFMDGHDATTRLYHDETMEVLVFCCEKREGMERPVLKTCIDRMSVCEIKSTIKAPAFAVLPGALFSLKEMVGGR